MIELVTQENREKVVNIADVFITLLNEMYLVHRGKKLIEDLLDPTVFEKFKEVYLKEEEPKIRQKIVKFWITLLDNCFVKAPKDLAFEEPETNFGFYFLRDAATEEKKEEGSEGKSGELLLNNLLHKESKSAAESKKYFGLSDAEPLVPHLSAILETIGKLLTEKTPYVKNIEKASLIMLLSKIVRLKKETLRTLIITNQLIEKSIVRFHMTLGPCHSQRKQ